MSLAGINIRRFVRGADPLRQALAAMEQLPDKKVKNIFAKAGRVIAQAAKNNVPVRTGELKKGIAVQALPAGAVIGIRQSSRARPRAHFAEWGAFNKRAGRYISGSRFMTKAADENIPEVVAVIVAATRKELPKGI